MNAREASARHSFVGSRIGKFDVIAEIGTGGMASVYLARATGTAGFNRLVAIKVMHPHLSQEDSFVEMFLDEARVAATIQHPNVVSIIDVGIEDGLIFLIMEYVEGDSFSNIEKMAVNLKRRIPLGIALRIVLDAAAGLQHAHELTDHQGNPLRIVHRDVSPQNVMVGVDGTARIVDFGIAKAESRITTTQVGLIKGKLNFMAPEQIRGGALDRRVDVFGLGVTLWEAVTLRRLFAGDNEFETARRILSGEYPSMREYDPKIPAELDEICRRALYPDPEYRFHTCAELADAIEGSLPHLVAAPREVSAFISGVASQKIERERSAIRETLATPTAMEVDDDLDDDNEPGFMSTTVVEIPGGTDAAPSAVHPIRAVLPSTSVPRDRSHEESSTTRRSPVRAPTMTMPSHAPQASGRVATVSSGEHNDPTATTRALRVPAAGAHDVYDDDGATSPFNAVSAAAQAKAFRDRIAPVASASTGSNRAGPSRVQPVHHDEPDDDSASEARTVFQPSYTPPPERTSSPSRSDASMSGPVPSYLSPVETSQVAPAARTMAIDLVQRRLSPDDLVEASSEVVTASAQSPITPPPPARVQSTGASDLFAPPPPQPARPYSLGPPAGTSSQPPNVPQFPMIPPDAARASQVAQPPSAGLPAVVYVLLSLVLVGGAAAALWFVLRGS